MSELIKKSDEVFYAPESGFPVSAETIAFLKAQAGETLRGRCRLCTHPNTEASLHEMLVVLTRGAYIRPHHHLGKAESLHVIEGEAELVFFENDGQKRDRYTVGIPGSGLPFYARLEEGQNHMLIPTSPWFIYHETTSGPFIREQTAFPAWAPEESDKEAVERFIAGLKTA